MRLRLNQVLMTQCEANRGTATDEDSVVVTLHHCWGVGSDGWMDGIDQS